MYFYIIDRKPGCKHGEFQWERTNNNIQDHSLVSIIPSSACVRQNATGFTHVNSSNPQQNRQRRKPKTKRKCHLPETTQQALEVRCESEPSDPRALLMAPPLGLSHCGEHSQSPRADPFPCSEYPSVCIWDTHGRLHWHGFGQAAPSDWLKVLGTPPEDPEEHPEFKSWSWRCQIIQQMPA